MLNTKHSTTKHSTTKQKYNEMDILLSIMVVLLLFIAIYAIYKIIKKTLHNHFSNEEYNVESFSASNLPDAKLQPQIMYGNLIKFSTQAELKRPLPEAEGRNIIQLQFPSKIIGFKFIGTVPLGNATDAIPTPKYKLFISESRQQLLNPRTRIEITIPETSVEGGFIFGKVYNTPIDFENEDGTPKFVGAFMSIEMADTVPGAMWANITQYQIFGLALNAPTITEYDKYINLQLTQVIGKTENTVNDLIKVTLKQDSEQMVGKIIITNFASDNDKYSPQCRIRYRNKNASLQTSLIAVNGPIRDQFINIPSATNWVLYLDSPIMAHYIELTFTDDQNVPINVRSAVVTLFGFTPTTRDIANFKLQAGHTTSDARMNLGGTNCPATSEMLNKQVQAQLICEALEYKDKEKNKRLAYERDKLYLQKLKAQEAEIRELEQHITGLITRKNKLASDSSGSSIDELETQLKAAENTRKQAEEYMNAKDAARNNIRLKVNLDPQFQALLK